MGGFERYFTLEEARAELPALREEFARIQALITELEKGQLEIERIRKLVRSNGHGSSHPDYGRQIEALQRLVAQITERGIQIKDLSRGLIDFPHWRDGEEVLLCWLVEEEDIEYWHTLEGGFAARMPLP